MTLPCISNDRATEIWPGNPAEFTPNVPEEIAKDHKPEYLKWRSLPDTQHMLFLGSEGIAPTVRPNKDTNPVQRLLAIIADYDAKISADMDAEVVKTAPVIPNWISTTYSGGRRLVWILEEPALFDTQLAAAFYSQVEKVLKLAKLLPGLDPGFKEAARPYDVGTNWRQLSDKPLSKHTINFWLWEAAKRSKFKTDDTTIPLDVVKEEIDKRWPGAWSGPFEEGSRGPVFFEGRKNPSAAVVMLDGIIAFSGNKLWNSWRDILGSKFVQQFTENKISQAVSDVWFDGTKYYRKFNDQRWMTVAKEDMVKWFKFSGLDPRDYHDDLSEVLQAEMYVQTQKRIDGVAPFLFDPRIIVPYGGMTLLNTSRVQAIPPGTQPVKWSEGFPFIARTFEQQFGDVQLPFWLGWLKRFYCSALAQRLQKGQATFLVGPVNCGKTLIGQRIVGPLVGGCADASDYVAGDSEFNKHLMPVALWVIDDGKLAIDARTRAKFGEMVKRIVANPQLIYRAMYNDSQMMDWYGRLLVTLNNDPYSIQMIPDMSISLEEKVLIFKIDKPTDPWPDNSVLEATIAAELPHLARYLVDMEIAKHVVGEARLGINPFVHEGVRALSLHSSGVGDIMEIIDLWIMRTTHKDEPWEGTAAEWFMEILSDPDLCKLIGKMTPRMIGKRFSEAAQMQNSGIEIIRTHPKRGNIYRIKRNRKDDDKE